MSLHRVELTYSEGGGDAFGGWLGTWITNMQPWEAHDNEVPSLVDPAQMRDPDADAPYYRGQLVFAWSEDKAIIRDQLTGYLDAYCSWWVLRYEVCRHDEDDPDACTWDEAHTGGTVPEWVDTATGSTT